MVQLLHLYMTTRKTIGKVMSLLLNILSRFVIAFLPRSKHLLISWLQSPSTMILEPKKIKSVTVSIVYPSICHEVMGLDGMILVFWMLSFKPAFSFSSSPLSKSSLVPLCFLPIIIQVCIKCLLTTWRKTLFLYVILSLWELGKLRQCCEMKRCLLLGRKAMTNLDSILKSRDITLLTKVCIAGMVL